MSCPGKWEQGLKPAVHILVLQLESLTLQSPWWSTFDPTPKSSPPKKTGCHFRPPRPPRPPPSPSPPSQRGARDPPSFATSRADRAARDPPPGGHVAPKSMAEVPFWVAHRFCGAPLPTWLQDGFGFACWRPFKKRTKTDGGLLFGLPFRTSQKGGPSKQDTPFYGHEIHLGTPG